MKSTILLCLFVLTASLTVRGDEAPATTKPAPAASPYALLQPFLGGLWVAELPADKSGNVTRIELRFDRPENKQGLRFESAFVTGDRRSPYTSGMYGWNGAKGKLVIVYMDSSGSLTEGTITPESGVLVHDLNVTDKAGKIDPVQVRMAFVSADVFTSEIFIRKDDAWSKIVAVRYERK